jgi:SAM-dependent methyltransferase
MSVNAPVSPNTDSATESSKHDYGVQGKIVGLVHTHTILSRRAKVLRDSICAVLPRGQRLTGVDIGCGNGILGLSITQLRPEVKMTGVDVHVWPKTVIPVTKYDGTRLPFEDKSVDFTILSDVLHHCDSPRTVLREAMRISRKFVIIKDHLCENELERATLRFMDWFGNRGYGVALPYKYFSYAEWNTLFAELGLKPEVFNTKLGLYPAPFNLLFERKLHFVTRVAVGREPVGLERWRTMSKLSQQLRLTNPMK